MDSQILGNTISDWFLAAGISIIVYVVLIVAKKILYRNIQKLAKKTETKVDDLLADLIGDTKNLILFTVALYAGSKFVHLHSQIQKIIEIVVIIVTLLQCGFWGNRLVTYFIHQVLWKQTSAEGDKKSVPAILKFTSKLIVWSIVLLLILDNLGVNVTTLLAGLGIGGIAVALALQNILGDLFSSLSIMIDRPFEVGDFIVVGEFRGTVEHIGLKTTRIRSLSGEQNIFSNTDLLQSRIRNFRRMSERRVEFRIGVTYQTPLEKLQKIPSILKNIITAQNNTRFDRAHFKEYGDSALVFEAVYFVLSADYNLYMDIQEQINLKIYEAFQQEKIEFAYPTRTLYINKG